MGERPPVIVYGSCVSRDTYEHSLHLDVRLHCYVARQSLISAFSAATDLATDRITGLDHAFQRRVLADDFASSLPHVLRSAPRIPTVLLWDLIDERLGVYAVDGRRRITRSIELIRAGLDEELATSSPLLEFGTDEHFAEWAGSLERFRAQLAQLPHIAPVLLDVPWAARDESGGAAAKSFGVRAEDANARARRYVDAVSRVPEIAVVTLDPASAVADSEHRWGAAPFHYSASTYEAVAHGARDALSHLNLEQGT